MKKRIPKTRAEESLPNNFDFHRKLASVYQEMGYKSAFFGSSYRYYEVASFSEENDSGINTQYHLHIGEVINIISEEESGSFAILRSIFSHQRNDQSFAFIIITRFELTNQTKLECPVYRLQGTQTICPISEVDTNSTAHFVHYCNSDECIGGKHDFKNNLYIRNMYFFKAV